MFVLCGFVFFVVKVVCCVFFCGQGGEVVLVRFLCVVFLVKLLLGLFFFAFCGVLLGVFVCLRFGFSGMRWFRVSLLFIAIGSIYSYLYYITWL